MLVLSRRLARVSAILALAAGSAIAAWAVLVRAPGFLAAAAGAWAFAAATWRAATHAPRPPAAFQWAGAVVFAAGAVGAQGWLSVPLALAAAGYAAAAASASAWRLRARSALT